MFIELIDACTGTSEQGTTYVDPKRIVFMKEMPQEEGYLEGYTKIILDTGLELKSSETPSEIIDVIDDVIECEMEEAMDRKARVERHHSDLTRRRK